MAYTHGEGQMEPLRNRKLSHQDYLSLPDDTRWELLDGRPYAMSGASVAHQELCRNLSVALVEHFRGKACQVFFAPLDVRLSDHDVVQPDLMVVCNRTQLKSNHVEGPPNLIVEIVSPSSVRHDRLRKFRLYAAAGVKEYWIFYPDPPLAEVYWLDGPGYRAHGVYSERETLISPGFSDLSLPLEGIFPSVDTAHEVKEAFPPYAQA